jgi:hypothetical protein
MQCLLLWGGCTGAAAAAAAVGDWDVSSVAAATAVLLLSRLVAHASASCNGCLINLDGALTCPGLAMSGFGCVLECDRSISWHRV